MTNSLIDMKSLENFVKGDPELLADLSVIFARFLPGSLASLNIAVENHDADLLRETAHQLKSQLSYFFAESLVAHANQLEELGKTGQVKSAGPVVEQVISGIEQLLEELNSMTSLNLCLKRD